MAARSLTRKTRADVEDAKLELVLELLAQRRTTRMVARGSSMWPALKSGDVVELRPLDGLPRLGAVVAVRPRGGGLLLHRVTALRADGSVLTHGDNTPAADRWFSASELVAEVSRVARARGWEPVGPAVVSKRVWSRRILSRLARRARRFIRVAVA